MAEKDQGGYSVPTDFITKFYSNQEIVLREHTELFQLWLSDDWDKLTIHPAQEAFITIGMFALAVSTIKSNDERRTRLERAFKNLEVAKLCSVLPTYASSDKINSRCTKSLEKLGISSPEVYPVRKVI